MKTKQTYHKILLTFILFIFIHNLFAQEIDLTDVVYNTNQIPHCGSINLNLNDSHYITFKIHLEKPYYQDNPNGANDINSTGTISIKLSARGTQTELASTSVFTNSWTNTNDTSYIDITGHITISNSELDIDVNDNIFVLYQSDFNYNSCNYTIKRPKFSLNPNNTAISCGSTGNSFTVINENSSPGTIQYHWNVGSGWMRNGVAVSNFTTTTNHITLVPYQYPPSDVHVTPILDGVAYDELTSTVSLSAFNPNLTVTGPASICSTGSYALQGSIPSNWSVVWSLQNTAIANLNQTGNNATVTANTGQSGYITTNAFVTNSCGQTKVFPKQIFVGSPVVL